MSGNDTVNWVLKVNKDDGHVTVRGILNSTNVLRTSVDSVLTSLCARILEWPIVVGVIGGVLFMAMVATVIWYLYLRPSKFFFPSFSLSIMYLSLQFVVAIDVLVDGDICCPLC